MIGLDTNVLVRYVMQDDPKQAPKATKIIESLTQEVPGMLPVVVLVEFVWVLGSCYELNRSQIAHAIDGILRTREFVIERSEQVRQALRIFQAGSADFADCLIERSASHAGCEKIVTFDVAAAKTTGMELIA